MEKGNDGFPILDTFKAEPGARAGKLVLLYKTEKRDSRNKPYWMCKCECGNQKEIRQSNLSDGARGKKGGTRSCGCKAIKYFKKRNDKGTVIEDFSNAELNGIKILSKTSLKDSNRSWYYKCECPVCKQPFLLSIRHIKDGYRAKNCGCISGKSLNEIAISEILKENNIVFKEQYKFEDCKNIKSLPFDFYINDKYIIEFDGKQHFSPVEFFGGEKAFIERRKNDLIKNEYCFINNIPIIRIPYNVDYNLSDLFPETSRYLLTEENKDKYYSLNQ
jgi:hypothetical protein